MKKSIKTILVATLACCVLASMTGCAASQEPTNTSTPSSVSSQIEETESGEITLESYLNAYPDMMEQLQGSDESVSVEVSGNTIRYTYVFTEDMAADQTILDSVMESMGDSFQSLTDTLADSTGLPIQMDVIYENAGGETIGAYSYVSAEVNDLPAADETE